MKAFKSDGEDSGQGRISRGVEVSGDVSFSDALQVDGRVAGKLVSESGSLSIEQNAEVKAEIDVGICIIRGQVHGNIKAKSRVEVYKTARVEGDIASPILLVEEGAQVSGSVTMNKEAVRVVDQRHLETGEQLSKSRGAS